MISSHSSTHLARETGIAARQRRHSTRDPPFFGHRRSAPNLRGRSVLSLPRNTTLRYRIVLATTGFTVLPLASSRIITQPHTSVASWARSWETMASVSSLDKDLRKMRLDKYTPGAANEARSWIENTLGERLPSGDLLDALKDGVALCRYIHSHPSMTPDPDANPTSLF